MSSLVGDIIMDVRRRIPDLPTSAPVPIATPAAADLAGATLGAGTYYVVTTCVGPFGETLPTAEQTVVVGGANNAIQIGFFNVPIGFTCKAYVGFVSGVEYLMFGGSTLTVPTQAVLNITDLADATNGIPPQRNTAFLPDTDGSFIGAFSMYGLLKRALDELVKISGGIIDVIGIQSQNGQGLYRVTAPNASAFMNFTNVWFDGYPMEVVPRRLIFLRNLVTGFSGLASFEHDGDAPIMQLWPYCNRTGGSTTLASPMGLTDTVANVSDNSAFLTLGLMQIDQEIMAFTVSASNQMTGVLRGLGGTVPATHNAGATVNELNIRLSGKRLAPTYQPGDALLPLRVPPAWEASLVLHMLSQARSMENDEQSAASLLKDFVGSAEKISKGSVGSTKPRQIQIGGDGVMTGLDTYNVNGVGFGWLIS